MKTTFFKTIFFLIVFVIGVLYLKTAEKLVSAQSLQYSYDSLNRLVEVRYPDKVIHYTYDAAGNRTGVTVEILVVAPAISNLSPRGAVVGGNALTLKINGSNFTNGSVVQWNGANRPTTFVSANELQITVNPGDIGSVGTASVVVVNSTPGLSVSNAQTFSVVQTAAFSGRIMAGSNGLSNATVNLTGTETGSATTDSNGNFNFALLANGSYTITPTRANYSFTPASRVLNYTGISQTNLDFTASLVNYSISGRIVRSNGAGVANVTIGLSGSQSGQVTTDSNGNYTINAVAEGNYTITPSLPGYAFTPLNRSFTNLSANQTSDFTAASVITYRSPFDFDGDNKTDVSIFRPSDGSWWYLQSSNAQFRVYRFGVSGDSLTPGDFTGDGKTDIAIFRPSEGSWYIQRSEDNSFFSFPFGSNGDIAAPADYDGDGKTDAAVFRPSDSTWYVRRSSDLGTSIVGFGSSIDKPVPADYDGDGKADIAIFRPSDGSWWYIQSSNLQFKVYRFGVGTDKPVQGDYTGDGKADLAVFRPSTGEWFFQRSEDNSFYSFTWGQAGDLAVPGDYDGDGKFDASIFRPSTFEWFMNQTTTGVGIVTFGSTGDRPVPNAFVR